MSSQINLSLFERTSSSLGSQLSAKSSEPKSSCDLNAEQLQKLKLQQHANLCKTDNTFNSGFLGSINTLQDSEMNDVIKNVENFMNLTIKSIDKNDHIIDMAFNPDDANNLGTKKSTTNQSVSDFQNYTDPSILIHGLVQTDLLRNGLKSGPLLLQKELNEPVETKNPKVTKPNLDTIPTLSNQLQYKILTGNKNKIIFKYFLVLDLNTFYFEFCKMNKMQPLYSVKLVNIPPNWTSGDLEQFTIEIKINDSPNKSNTFPTLRKPKVKQPTPIYINYLPKRKTAKFLNSRAIFDRIYRHFARVLNYEWNVNEKPPEKEPQKYFDKERTCEINDNQLKIVLKFKGMKHKDLEVVLLIDLVIRLNDPKIEKKIFDSMVTCSNNFFQCGGLFTEVPLITETTMNFIINWMKKHLKCDLKTMYLKPNCVHYWSLNIHPLKQNFLRFLCWVNNFTDKSAESIVIVNLLNGIDTTTTHQLRTFFANQLHRQTPNYTFSQILVNCSQSCLYLVVKQLQLLNYLSLSKRELCEKVGNNIQSEDTLLPDIIFAEINYNATHGLGKTWCNVNLFDLFWSSIMRFRYFIIKCLVPDNFHVLDNVLPIEYLQYIGMQSFNIIPYLNKRQNTLNSRSDFFITSKQLEDNEVSKYVESAMKLILTGVLPEEKEREIAPMPFRAQTNLSELSNKVYKKPDGYSYVATLGGSERDCSRSDYMNSQLSKKN